jgi:hypothetical protein
VRDRTFDYRPRLVEANRQFRVQGAHQFPLLANISRYWIPGLSVLDQGSEGACVGFGVTGEAMASPVRQRFPKVQMTDGATWRDASEVMARKVYKEAQQIDEWEGDSYDGTSVRAGMLVGRERGWWDGFRWAFSMADLRAALEEGPVVLGVLWTEGMYEALGGRLVVTGPAVGGHCILSTGYSANWRGGGPHYRLRNSWGRSWGLNGSAYIKDSHLNKILFEAGGEAAVPVNRKLAAA